MADQTDFPIPSWKEDDVLDERYTINVVQKAMDAALNVMLLGKVDQANRIIDLLYQHNDFEYEDPCMRVFMHYAWDTSGKWPAHVSSPSSDKIPPESKAMVEEYNGRDGPDLIPRMHAKDREFWTTKVFEKDPNEPVWTTADFQKARQAVASAEWTNEYAKAASIEIAFELEMDEVAMELMREHLLKVLTEEDAWTEAERFETLSSPRIWKVLSEGWLRKEMDVSLADIEYWVNEVLRLLEVRLSNGARRPLKDHSIEQLIEVFDKSCLEKRHLGGSVAAPSFPVNPKKESDKIPTTFLKPAAPEAEIKCLESKAKKKGYPASLPSDYKDFLHLTNGIYAHSRKASGDEMFRPANAVSFDDVEDLDFELELLPVEATGYKSGIPFEWPVLDHPTLNFGAGGDEGYQWLVHKRLVKEGLEAIDEVLQSGDAWVRRRIERAAKDVYGSLETLRGLEWIVLRHGGGNLECFGSFRELLEVMTQETVDYEEDEDEGQDEDDDEENEEDDGGEWESEEDEGDEDNDDEDDEETMNNGGDDGEDQEMKAPAKSTGKRTRTSIFPPPWLTGQSKKSRK